MPNASVVAVTSPGSDSIVRRVIGRVGRARPPWWVLVGLVVVSGGVLGLASEGGGFLERFMSGGDADGLAHTVKPVNMTITLTEDGELEPVNSVDLKCELEGQSTIRWVVEESTKVKKGDLLIELASDTIQERVESEEIELQKIRSSLEAAEQELALTRNENASKIKAAEIAFKVAELELQRYLEGDYQKSLKSAEINIKQTQMDIARKRDELEKNRALLKRGFVTPSHIEQLEFDLEKALMSLERAELEQYILKEYEFPKNEMQKRSEVESTKQELERERKRAESREAQALARVQEQSALLAMREKRHNRMKEQLEKCKIYAPVDGVVQYPNSRSRWGNDNSIAVGEKVFEGQTLLTLPDTSQMVVETRIHEADRHKVQPGMTCLVRVPAVPGETFVGKLDRIARFADSAHRWLNPELKEHATQILLDHSDPRLSPGDTAEVKILVEEVPEALAIPVQCVFVRGKNSYVFKRDGGSASPIEVELGRSNSTMVEVVSGLQVNDEVLMQVGEDLLAELPSPTAVAAAESIERAEKKQGEQAKAAQSEGKRERSREGRRGSRASRG